MPTCLTVLKTLPETLNTYLDLKQKMIELKKELDSHKVILETAIMETENSTLWVDDYRLKLTELSRENFSLKTAREKMGNKILSPFIKLSHYSRLSISKTAAQ